jgi:hypothetical protein
VNIFVLHKHPRQAARMQCDQHVVKMTLESAQMLSTVINELGGEGPYKSTHVNHPCSVWARQSLGNFLWLYDSWPIVSQRVHPQVQEGTQVTGCHRGLPCSFGYRATV